jgi:enamine deaminase RidA (YjgF/YER057c/UK114 family)
VIDRLHSPDLHPTSGYHHATVVSAGRLAFLAGQMPMDATGEQVVGVGDLDTQVDVTVANSLRALALAQAAPADVVRSVVYVVSSDPATLARAWHRIAKSALGPALTSASTLVGVAALGFPDQLVEIDLTAALPG